MRLHKFSEHPTGYDRARHNNNDIRRRLFSPHHLNEHDHAWQAQRIACEKECQRRTHPCSEKNSEPCFNSFPNDFPSELAGISADKDRRPEHEFNIGDRLIAKRSGDQDTPVIEIVDAV